MTEQTDREHHNGNGNKKEHAHVDKDQRQNKQYNYEQARSTRHAGRLADFEVNTTLCFNMF
jgi:hypothetical protein